MRSVQKLCRNRESARRRPAAPISPREVEIAGELDDRVAQRLRLAGRHEQARLAVAHELAEPADRGGDHRARTLHRLERDHAEALAHRRDDDDRGALDRGLDRRDLAEEAHGVGDAELARERLQRRLERPAPGDLELEIRQLPRAPRRTRAAGRCGP